MSKIRPQFRSCKGPDAFYPLQVANGDNLTKRREAIARVAEEADIVEIARSLGMPIVEQGSGPKRTLCPFHEDRKPSLYLYQSKNKDQYHCFACGAHGDVFDLLKKVKNTDFRGSLQWLSDRYNIPIPSSNQLNRNDRIVPRSQGLELGLSIYSKQNANESKTLQGWARDRKIDAAFLHDAEVYAAFSPKLTKARPAIDREQSDLLASSGLLIRSVVPKKGEGPSLPIELPPHDFYRTSRIIFAIRDDRGMLTGFAGRALEADDQPKYLFSPGFPKANTLYRFDKVRSDFIKDQSKPATLHLFLVEGLMDALRLESLGLNAVAILGSQITSDQLKLIADFSKDLDRSHCQLALHIFLDADQAGRRGTSSACIRLLDISIENPGLLIDVIFPPNGQAVDPDQLLSHVKTKGEALALLESWCVSSMNFLVASGLESTTETMENAWCTLPEGQQIRLFRDIERRIDRNRWAEIVDRVPIFSTNLGAPTESKGAWQESLARFLSAIPGRPARMPAPTHLNLTVDDNARLVRALQIAEASTQRREFPVDEGSWERLLASLHVVVPWLTTLLKDADKLEQHDLDPMLAVAVPKSEDKFRIKALPCAEVLTIQQYVLNEILRDYTEPSRFEHLVPGVRFSSSSGIRRTETTGGDSLTPSNGETVSFAYTIDMDVVQNRTPPRRNGMFRSYHECWRDFISYIDGRVSQFPSGKFHVARLDVRSFYESVPRSSINAVLLPGLTSAMLELHANDEQLGARSCAGLFLPNITVPEDRARAIVDWLCEQSYGYEYEPLGNEDQPTQPAGLPQGPDLSAYLANISLFPLDKALSELVSQIDNETNSELNGSLPAGLGSSIKGAVYARYVDDMVIIARSAHDLARLRTKIEQELGRVGMQLSPKTDPVPVMDEAAVRDWITDRRGMGKGVSGPFDGPPVNDPASFIDPFTEVGEIDRSASLRLLYDPRLEDPNVSIEELLGAVETVLSVPVSQIRHGDKVGAARHLWRSALITGGVDATPTTYIKTFITRWRECHVTRKRGYDTTNFVSLATLLAWLDGIERFLTSRPDRNPSFSADKHEVLRGQRILMSELVQKGLCQELISHALAPEEGQKLNHMLDLKLLVIFRIAVLIRQFPAATQLTFQPSSSRAKSRLLISLSEAVENSSNLDSAAFRSAEIPLTLLFHESVARLRTASKNGLTTPFLDPLEPVRPSMELRNKLGVQNSPLSEILKLWMPVEGWTVDLAHAETALTALVNLAPSIVVELITNREALRNYALTGSSRKTVSILPTLPGLEASGLLGLSDENTVVLRAHFIDKDQQEFRPELVWKENSISASQKVQRYHAPLKPYDYLPLRNDTVRDPNLTRWLARAFRSLAVKGESADDSKSAVPTAYNILGPDLGADNEESSWDILGFCIEAKKIRGQAFLRQGSGGLVLEPISGFNDHLWRVGTALADWLGRGHSTRQLSTQRICST